MSNDLNLCQFIGRLGKDPQSRSLPSGETVCNFSIACDQSWKDKDSGEQKKKTEWVNVVAFSRLAEICSTYLKKGSQVYLSGTLQTRKWEKDGVTRYSTEVRADKMQMLGPKPAGQATPDRPPAQSAAPGDKNFEDDESDIPF